jgi:PAS domain S-box-containing protein
MLQMAMVELTLDPARGLPKDSGWPALFSHCFKSSRNAMVLLDSRRVLVEVNGASVELIGYPPSVLIGQPMYRFVADGQISAREWRALLRSKQFTGIAELIRSDGSRVKVEFAGHPEVVTGRQLVLGVAMRTARSTRRLTHEPPRAITPLTDRELDVVGLIAMGLSGPEIATELHLAHNTVRTHARNAMNKTGARSRAHLVAKHLGAGLPRSPS